MGIEEELKTLEERLFEVSTEYRDKVQDAALKRADYDVEYAKAMLKISSDGTKMTVPEKEALALTAVEQYFVACRIAEAMADGTKRHLEALQSILSSVQTRARMLKAEMAMASYAP